jgi:hypothetical protein
MPGLPVRADRASHSDSGSRERGREIAALCSELDCLYADIQSVAAESRSFIDGVPPDYRESARNPIHSSNSCNSTSSGSAARNSA